MKQFKLIFSLIIFVSVNFDNARMEKLDIDAGFGATNCPGCEGLCGQRRSSLACQPCGTYDGNILYITNNQEADICITEIQNGFGFGNITLEVEDGNFSSVVGVCKLCINVNRNSSDTGPTINLVVNGTRQDICHPNAEGLLCSDCITGFYHNLDTECVECNHVERDWFLFILAEFLPITLMFFILLFTNFSLVSGALNSSIFFAQMVTTTMDLEGNGYIPLVNLTHGNHNVAYSITAVYKFIYGPLNLDFFSPFIDKVCLFKRESYLPYFAVQYAVAFYPLFLVGILITINQLYTCNITLVQKCRKHLSCCLRLLTTDLRESSRNVLASFILLAYTKFALISTYLITPNILYDSAGRVVKRVPYYDANIEYFKGNHTALAVIALFILLFVALLPFLLVVLRYEMGLTPSPSCISIDVFLEPYQRPFKRGCNGNCCSDRRQYKKISLKIHDYRWVAGVYFFLRLSLLIAFIATNTVFVQFIVQQLVCILGAVLFLFIQPYDNMNLNKLDVFMLLVLAFINTLSIYQYYLASRAFPLSLTTFIIQYILIFIPAVWIAIYIMYNLYHFFKRCQRSQRYNLNTNLESESVKLNQTSWDSRERSSKTYETF